MPPEDSIAPPDPILAVLYEVQVHNCSFRQLTGVDDPWQLNRSRIERTRDRMAREDRVARGQYPGKDISCIAWTDGAFWLLPEGVQKYAEAMDRNRSLANGRSIQPIWRMTLRELLLQHTANLRQLVLSVAYDLVSIEILKEKLPSDHAMLKKEFARCEKIVGDLVEELLKERERLGKVLTENVELYERTLITEQMLRRGEVSEEVLGYTVEDLRRAQDRVRDLCQQELNVYQHVLGVSRGRMQEGLRSGEHTQLTRTSRWDYTFHQFAEPPEGFMGFAMLVSHERKRLAAIVSSREEELGFSEEGKELLDMSKKLDTIPEPGKAPAVEEPPQEPPTKEEPPKEAKKKIVRRMATADRHQR
ncbi:MAG TPA: hypothetical protein PLY86_20910 [bacterium]|nr:hypothetical protein [bacterium]